jgi:transcriptional regulator with XRE-family HTH domain
MSNCAELRGATLYAKLVGALMSDVPQSYAELADYSGLSYYTVRRYVNALRDHRPRLVKIAEWSEDIRGARTIPCFLMGSEPDAKRLKISEAERQRRYRAGKASKVASVFALGERV